MPRLSPDHESRLANLATALVDQSRAKVIVPARQDASGFWFGGGNMIERDGGLLLVGRYRNHGDSRTGLGAGERGVELAVFESNDRGRSFAKVLSFAKPDFDVGPRRVLSIEGSAVRWTSAGVELFVSSEKAGIGYPAGLADFAKPGTGVWTIERLAAESLETLKSAPIETVIECRDPRFLHVKDPLLYQRAGGDLLLMFCTHPYCWSSSNTGYAVRKHGQRRFAAPSFEFFPRGFTWDVAITRATAAMDVPRVGMFEDLDVTLLFYDGGESLRNLDEHQAAVHRPRGYSCEELGGAAYFVDGRLESIYRLSQNRPLFVSPMGTGCSRYVDVLPTREGYFTTWQQSQQSRSQPLVMHVTRTDEVVEILA